MRMTPRWCSSKRLMQRISVDLPDPEGPQMTMRLAAPDLEVDVAQYVETRRTICERRASLPPAQSSNPLGANFGRAAERHSITLDR